MKTLIVEDQLEGAIILQENLAVHGFEAVHVWNGAEVLQKLRAEPFDLVITDLVITDLLMSQMDGRGKHFPFYLA